MDVGLLPPIEVIEKTLRSGKVAGKGANAEVRYVEGYPDYVLKIPAGFFNAHGKHPDVSAPNLVDDAFSGRNFGQAVAQYGDCQLLKFQPGVSCGVPPYLRLDKSRQDENDALYERSTAAVSEMPQSAYEDLFKDILFLNSIEARIDPCKGNNVLIDEEKKRFDLVDVELKKGAGLSNAPSELVVMFFDNSYAWRYEGGHKNRLAEHRRTILEKALSAAEKLGIPFVKETIDVSLSYALDLAGYEGGTAERLNIEKRIMELSQPPQRRSHTKNSPAVRQVMASRAP